MDTTQGGDLVRQTHGHNTRRRSRQTDTWTQHKAEISSDRHMDTTQGLDLSDRHIDTTQGGDLVRQTH